MIVSGRRPKGGGLSSLGATLNSIPTNVRAEYDAAARAYSLAVKTRTVPALPWNDASTHDVYMDFGQSLAAAGCGHPPKTLTVPAWGIIAWMAGSSVRAAREDDIFYPFGSVGSPSTGGTMALQALKATMDNDNAGSGSLWDPAVMFPSRTPLSGTSGEAPVVGLIYDYYRRRQLAGQAVAKQAIGCNLAQGGTILRDLIDDDGETGGTFAPKFRTQSYFSQLLAQIGPATINLVAVAFDQGQAETQQTTSSNWKTWDDTFAQFLDFLTLVMSPWGQTRMPAVLMTQTGGGNWGALGTPAAKAIPDQQHEVAMRYNHVWLCSPAHAVPQKMYIPVSGLPVETNGHLDGNAYRWNAAYKAKVLSGLRDGVNFEHVNVVSAVCRGREVMLSFNLPVPPITVRDAFIGYRKVFDGAGLGYTFEDVDGAIPVHHYELYGTHSVVLFLGREPGLGATFRGGLTGFTNVADSDTAKSNFNYQHSNLDFAVSLPSPYVPTSQENAIEADVLANLGSLNGKPYPLPNFSIAQSGSVRKV